MVHLSQFKANLLSFTRLMLKSNMAYVDVVYKGRLIRYSVEDLGVEVVKRRRPRKRSLVDKIDAKKCPECRKLMLNNVCMNSLCASNLPLDVAARKPRLPVAQ